MKLLCVYIIVIVVILSNKGVEEGSKKKKKKIVNKHIVMNKVIVKTDIWVLSSH